MITMPGTMMDLPLTIGEILDSAVANHGAREIVSRNDDGSLWRYTYRDLAKRVARLANALRARGIKPGDRVGTFAWNTHRHLELYYAVPMIGAVLHTLNVRLFPEQVSYIIRHADDKVLFVDPTLAKAVEAGCAMHPEAARPMIVMNDDYEALLAGQSETIEWPEIDERSAATLCYTSATTGDPKGVAFTHRSQVLHALNAAMPDMMGIVERDAVMPVVPMFHVNAWGIPYICLMVGAKLVLPGSKMDALSLIDLIERERVSFSAGVPTVWLAVRDELEKRGSVPPALRRIVCGGSAVPPAMFDAYEKLGIRVVHAWGMTEMSPLGTVTYVKSELEGSSESAVREALLSQGIFGTLVRWKLLGDDGLRVPADGTTPGDLWVRGHFITASYYRNEEAQDAFRDGWFRTGDICTVDEHGYLRIVDRSKDLIKSGGEWISSVDLENTIMGHPGVKEATVIGLPHEKWIERPVAVVVAREGHTLEEGLLTAWIAERVAKWWVPDRIVFIDSIPRTGVGKFLKRELRDRYRRLLDAGVAPPP